MKIKIYTIDVRVSSRLRRLLVWGTGALVVLGLGALAFATGGPIAPDYRDGDILSASRLNEQLSSLQGQITDLSGKVDALTTSAATASTNITDLQTRVSSLEGSRRSYVLALGSSTSSNSNYADVVFTNEAADQLSEWDGTAFTASAAGIYVVSWSLTTAYVPWDRPDVFSSYLSKNGQSGNGAAWEGWSIEVPYAMSSYLQGSSSVTLKLAAGDTLHVKVIMGRAAGNVALDGSTTDNYFSVVRVQ